ncbi:MAG: 4-hydroxy-3-methylbut-2-en-1-yl diphosphate synthase [Deltaproteobacteria bacterium RBG_13_61_14]|nr:MAG: 4-hydroxy-3-methylbut-2-en-1-yl diphosphate synthase [Deltaproteobacteria bacterium RBG_13_61_14]
MNGIPAPRRPTRTVHVGSVAIGSQYPVKVQSMTNTPTHQVKATLGQIERLAEAGCEIVRVSVPDEAAALALPKLVAHSPVPLIADIHFDHRLALKAVEAGVAGLRLNPGNLRSPKQVALVASAAKDQGIPIRVGVNSGSVPQDLLKKFGEPTPSALVEAALRHVELLEKKHFSDIKVSLKATDVATTVAAYRLLAKKVDYPFHLGITEAGTAFTGTVKSAIGLGILLAEGIGDTIRVSLAADPVEEVRVAWEILKSLGLRRRGVEVIACPTCSRAAFDVAAVAGKIEKRLASRQAPLRVAVMGCIVNGPGEATLADLGLVGTNKGVLLYVEGRKIKRGTLAEMTAELLKLAKKK